MNTTATEAAENRLKYHAQAKRYLYERGRLDEATAEELQSVADWCRYEEFRRNIEPYERARNHIMSQWISLQVNPQADMPQTVKDCVAGWNDLIASKAREFGFEVLTP